MGAQSQKRAVKSYRERLAQRGVKRFEVIGLDRDRDLIRSLAKRLAEDDPETSGIRETVRQSIGQPAPRKGGILDALRRSPLLGAELGLTRPRHAGRETEL